ncbi:hypothetical protein [Carboxylicivirga sp. RSCT41]|uniref:hypothetical protein n=1 Tax=Carboxylicivirga agarovorans TaxID=3417570 RepID=UPI003D32BD52
MKNQILRLAFVICAISMFTCVNAQKLSKKAEETVKKEVAEMSEVMQLSAEQQEKVLELKTALRLNNQKANKTYEKNSTELKNARKENMKLYTVELKKVCSKEQLSTWQKHKQAKKNK